MLPGVVWMNDGVKWGDVDIPGNWAFIVLRSIYAYRSLSDTWESVTVSIVLLVRCNYNETLTCPDLRYCLPNMSQVHIGGLQRF